MKKNNGGYALPYVLVVMTILSLVAVSVMSNTLTGLQTQKLSTARMQSRYAAEGEIEKVFAQLHTLKGKDIQATVDSADQSLNGTETDAQKHEKAQKRIQQAFDNEVKSFLGTDVKFVKSTYDAGVYTCELTSLPENEGVTISCIMNLKVTLEEKKESDESKDSTELEDSSEMPKPSEPAEENNVTYTYTVNSLEITYSSYVITYN